MHLRLISCFARGMLQAQAPNAPRMAKCPYCHRPLRQFGTRCRACRRYVLRWPHIVLLSVAVLTGLALLLDLLLRVY
jgi:hypothetical protein